MKGHFRKDQWLVKLLLEPCSRGFKKHMYLTLSGTDARPGLMPETVIYVCSQMDRRKLTAAIVIAVRTQEDIAIFLIHQFSLFDLPSNITLT